MARSHQWRIRGYRSAPIKDEVGPIAHVKAKRGDEGRSAWIQLRHGDGLLCLSRAGPEQASRGAAAVFIILHDDVVLLVSRE